jgi:hypothetical protein
VDDYYLFAHSDEEGRRALVHLSEALLTHEGLTLSRIKTRLMSADEFHKASAAAPPGESEATTEAEAKRLLHIRLKYDPYSPTAEEDYRQLAAELQRFDIVGMLARELQKSRIDEPLTRQLVKSLKYLSPETRGGAVESLIGSLSVLFPVFPTVAIVLRGVIGELSKEVADRLYHTLRELIRTRSHILLVGANLTFAIRLIVHDISDETDVVLNQAYHESSSMLVRRDIILAMAVRGKTHWIADRLRKSTTLTQWEQRALIPASFILGDEGKHWRQRNSGLSKVDGAFAQWCGEKNSGTKWSIPF